MMSTSFITDALADMHVHLRERKEVVEALIKLAIKGGADTLLPIPNFQFGLMTVKQVLQYIEMAKSLVPEGQTVHFLPTMMVNEDTPLDELRLAADSGIHDIKFMPHNRSTNSDFGFHYFWRLMPHMKLCGSLGIRGHLHPENPWMLFGNRDAEYQCLTFAEMALTEAPDFQLFWEHGTDARCIPFWKDFGLSSSRFFVTLTAHHLDSNEEQAFGDVRKTCKPPIKTERDRSDLGLLVAEDHPWVLAGGDGAIHSIEDKFKLHGKCACGANTSPFLMPLYAHALHPVLNLDTGKGRMIFGNFTSRNARRVFNLPKASKQVILVNKRFQIPDTYDVADLVIMSYGAREYINWELAS
jgi:dihydroorotase